MTDDTNELLDHAAAEEIDALIKKESDEIRGESQDSFDSENSLIQQNTAALNQNIQAQRTLNELKKETIIIEEQLKGIMINNFADSIRDSVSADYIEGYQSSNVSGKQSWVNNNASNTVTSSTGNVIGFLNSNELEQLNSLSKMMGNITNLSSLTNHLNFDVNSALVDAETPEQYQAAKKLESAISELKLDNIVEESINLKDAINALMFKARTNLDLILESADTIEKELTINTDKVSLDVQPIIDKIANEVTKNLDINKIKQLDLDKIDISDQLESVLDNLDLQNEIESIVHEGLHQKIVPEIGKFANTFLGGGDLSNPLFRNTRDLYSNFLGLQENINRLSTNPVGMTYNEEMLATEANKVKVEFQELIDAMTISRNTIRAYEEQIHTAGVEEDIRLDLYKKINKENEEYNEKLKALNEGLLNFNQKASKDLKNIGKEDPNAFSNTDTRLRDAKMAWKRDEEQTAMLLRNGELSNYSATGSFKNALQKTLFNRSDGFRQRQGLVGYASNLGYNMSGVGLSMTLGGLATAFEKAGKAVLEFAKGATEAYGEIQSIKTNLGIVSGSQAEADQTFNEIAAYSVKSPFGVQTVSEFAVLLKQSGVYASDLMDTLKQIGDVAGGNQEKFSNIANAFSQIEANGKATTRQLRQFATAGIPIYRELSKELGVGIDQIRKMTEEGEISSKVIEKVFSNMTGEGGVFENAVNIGAKTWKARQQNLADAKQLAQAALGEYMINFGGTGRGDSIAEQILGLKEGIYEIINNLFTLQNINNNVSKIANQDTEVQRLQRELEILEAGGASDDVLQAKRDQIVAAATYLNDDQQRAYARTAYETVMSKYDGKQEVDEKTYKQWIEDAKGETNLDAFIVQKMDGKNIVFVRDETTGELIESGFSYEKYAEQLARRENARSNLAKSYTREQYQNDYERVKDLQGMTNVSKALESTKRGFELLDKSINSNPYNPSNKTGLYAQLQQSASKYEQTEEGKKKKEEQDRIDWENMRSLWDTYSQYISEDGRLMRNFAGTAEEAIEMMTSGIITPLENISLAPEDLAKDWVGLTNLTGDERAKKEEELNSLTDEVIGNFRNQAISIMNFSDTTDTSRQVLMRFVGSLIQAEQMIKGGLGVQGTEYLATIYNNAMSDLGKLGQGNAASILSMATTRTSRTEKAKSWDELNSSKSSSKDTYPLWQRILNQSFGTSLDLFKNGAITRGDQAVNLWATQQKRQGIQNMSRSMLNTMNYKDVMSNLAYSGGNYVIGNTSKLGVTQIDWDKTYKNFSKFSMSLESAAEVTRAYSDSLQSDVDTLRDFMSSAFTITEDAANVYDPEYQKHLGDLSKNIKALDANAYDMMFTVDKDTGLITLRENATSAAQALLEEKQTMLAFADATATAKESIKQMNDEIRATSISRDINMGKYDNAPLLQGMKIADKNEFVVAMSDMLNNDTWKSVYEDESRWGKKITWEDMLDMLLNKREYLGTMLIDSNKAKSEEIEAKRKELESQIESLKAEVDKAKVKYVNAYVSNESLKIEGKEENGEKLSDYEKWFKDATNSEKRESAIDQFNKGNAAKTDIATAAYINSIDNLKKVEDELNNLGETSDNVQDALGDLVASWDKDAETFKNRAQVNMQKMFSEGFLNLRNQGIEEGKVDLDRLNSVLFSKDIYEGNNRDTQRVMDFMGLQGYSAHNFFDTLFKDNKSGLSSFMDNSGLNKEELGSLANKYKNDENVAKILNSLGEGESFEDILTKGFDSADIEKAFFAVSDMVVKAKELKDTMKQLGDQMMETFQGSMLDGFNKSMSLAGKHMVQLSEGTYDAESAGQDYAKAWKDIAQGMLEAMGPALTQAGLKLLIDGNYAAGATLLAAGGVISLMSGWFNDDADKSKEEESRLKSLKDLLADLIDQAKTDAQYYEKNFKHENALSEANKISVNDAIITPNGNVISTAPDDYLIATKTPGSLGKGGTVVNFTLIDNSTGEKNVKTEQKENDDGSVDIITVITDAVGQAIADGTLDGAFESRDYRMKGNVYTY